MISLISSLSLKLYLNSLVHHRNIFGSYSKLKSSDIFSENVRERSSGLRNNFRKSSEIFGKWSEIFGKSSKTPSLVCLYNKKEHYTLAQRYEFYVRVARDIVEILFLPREHKVHIFDLSCNVLFLYKYTDDGVFDDFPTTFRRFLKIFQNCSEGQ